MCKISGVYKNSKKVKIIIFNHTNYRNSRPCRPVEIGDKFEDCFKRLLGDDAEITHVKENINTNSQNSLEEERARHEELRAPNVQKLMKEGWN